MFERLWVRIPAPYTGWTFFTLICCKNCIITIKTEREAGVGPFKKTLFGKIAELKFDQSDPIRINLLHGLILGQVLVLKKVSVPC